MKYLLRNEEFLYFKGAKYNSFQELLTVITTDMKNAKYSGLKKAFSSQLRVEERDGVDVIIKQADAQESQSELFFQEQLKRIGLSVMEMELDDEGLAVTFISDAETLGDN